jgi:hypothetical protein
MVQSAGKIWRDFRINTETTLFKPGAGAPSFASETWDHFGTREAGVRYALSLVTKTPSAPGIDSNHAAS